MTDYKSIERWWEIVFSAYLLVSLHGDEFKHRQQMHSEDETEPTGQPLPFSLHPNWKLSVSWKSALNNLRLLLQPYWCWGWIEDWLQLFPVAGLKQGIHQLMDWMDTFRILTMPQLQAA